MTIYADDPLNADANDESACGPDCECADRASVLTRLEKILLECEDCDCEDCNEILFVAEAAFAYGTERGEAFAQEAIDEATSEAVKSAFDTVALGNAFNTAYEDEPVSYEDEPVGPVQADYSKCWCGDPECDGPYEEDKYEEDEDCNDPDCPCHDTDDAEALFLDDTDEDAFAFDFFSVEADEEEPVATTPDYVLGLVIDLANNVGDFIDQTRALAAAVGQNIGELIESIEDLKTDVKTIDERQESDVVYLDAVGARVLEIEQWVNDQKDTILRPLGLGNLADGFGD